MNKYFFVCTLMLLWWANLPAQIASSNWFTIKGFLPEWNGAVVELMVNGKFVKRDTVHEDMYSFTGQTSEPQEAQLKIIRNRKPYYLPLFIEPGTIKIRDEKQKLVAYGTPTNETYTLLIEQFDSLALLQKQLRFSEIKNFKRDLAVDFIKQHPNSLISIKLLAEYFHLDKESDDTLYYQLFTGLDKKMRTTYTGKKLKPEIETRYATAIGRQVPPLQLPGITNEIATVYDKGKYTLINFWASWCLPCRREHPKLTQLYKQYKEQGFTIVSISLDTNRSAWINGIKTEKLEWKQLSDLKGWESPVISFFGAKLIPYNILLNPEGIVIAKNVNTDEIEQQLAIKAGFTRFIGPL